MGSDTNALHKSTETDPCKLIVELCKCFYTQGWVAATGGGMSIKEGRYIYIAPSGVQKERMLAEDMFILDAETNEYIHKPEHYKPSACTPLFMASYTKRKAGACIHTHSENAVLATLLFDKEFKISCIENIKAIPKVVESGNLSFYDTLTIPIIENAAHEDELEPDIQKALEEYPMAPAVLVRRHGIFVWGDNVWKAKIINEAIDYLMSLGIKMRQLGFDPSAPVV